MKRVSFYTTHIFYLVIGACFCMLSCRKAIVVDKERDELKTVGNFSTSNCRLLGTAVMVHRWDNQEYWVNTLIKWYDQQGRLSHLKVFIPREWWMYVQRQFYLDYGEMIYDGDMIYLKDVYYDRIIMKVKLDEDKRPKTSWFLDSLEYGFNATFLVADTSEYFYLPDGRMDSIHSEFSNLPYPNLQYHWHFVYDDLGDVIQLQDPSARVNFKYDYTKPTNGMATDYLFSVPLKLMEYMDLIKFPHHYQLTKVIYGSHWPGAPYEDETFGVFGWMFANVQSSQDGTVFSYKELYNYPTENSNYYNAWDCGQAPAFSRNPSREEFMRLVH